MSPAGLYRYFDSLDSLLTELIADAYNDLADTVDTATTGPGTVRERLLAGMLAYRRWSLDHPNQFLLIFGTPIPGYAAPEEGPTVEANRRVGAAFFDVVVDGWRTGTLGPAGPAATRHLARAGVSRAGGPGLPGLMAHSLRGRVGALPRDGDVGDPRPARLDLPRRRDFYRAEVERLIDSWVVDG